MLGKKRAELIPTVPTEEKINDMSAPQLEDFIRMHHSEGAKVLLNVIDMKELREIGMVASKTNPVWPGKYKIPESMGYAKPKKGESNRGFMATVATFGYGCRYNVELLKIAKIIHTNPVCYHSVQKKYAEVVRWDVWLVDISGHDSVRNFVLLSSSS